jgi:hypothetical protein
MKILRSFPALAGALVVLIGTIAGRAPIAFAAQEKTPSACQVRSRSEALAVLVCQPKLDEAALVTAGKSACGTRVQCNAWMWDDASKAPAKAPARDAAMPKDAAAAAIGIWTNDAQAFVRIRPARP